MVIKSLFLYGISLESGKIFALVAHTSTNLIYLIFGLAAFLLLPVLNRKVKGEKM
jgi:Flp pilus assembly protein TadB